MILVPLLNPKFATHFPQHEANFGLAALGAEPSFRPNPYIGTPGASLWRGLARRLLLSAAAITIAFAAGGCSFSYKLGSMLGTEEKSEPTGAISAPAEPAVAAPPASSREADLELAKAAAKEALARGRDDSVPWENPKTGARGTVTPLASAYTQDGFVCRDFLASYVHKGAESWLQCEACRIHHGRWEVRAMKPWKRT